MSKEIKAKHQCPVCTKVHNYATETITVDNDATDGANDNVTQTSLCKEHDDHANTGNVFLIGVNESDETNVTIAGADRTGSILMMPRHVAKEIFNNTELPDDECIMFATESVLDKINDAVKADREKSKLH